MFFVLVCSTGNNASDTTGGDVITLLQGRGQTISLVYRSTREEYVKYRDKRLVASGNAPMDVRLTHMNCSSVQCVGGKSKSL